MNSLFTILVEKKYRDGTTGSSYQNYRVYYDEEKMQQFLDNIKLQYQQKYRAYGTANDMNTLQDFSVIDEIEKEKISEEGKFGEPNLYHYRYKRYPAIYKLFLNSLTAESFSLDTFVDYYNVLRKNGEFSLCTNLDLIACLSNKTPKEIENNDYIQSHRKDFKVYNDSELKMTKDEYKKILNKYLSLIKLKYEALNGVSVDTTRLAIYHRDYLIDNELFDDTIIAKKFRKI